MRLAVFILIGVHLIARNAFAQTDSSSKSLNLIIKTSIFTPISLLTEKHNGFIFLGDEKQIAKRQSMELDIYYQWTDVYKATTYYPATAFTATSIIPKYKYYVSKKNTMQGFYCGGYGAYIFQKSKDYYQIGDANPFIQVEGTNQSISFGALSGWQFLFWKNHIALDLYMHLGWRGSLGSTEYFEQRIGVTNYNPPNQNSALDYFWNLNFGWKF